MSGSSNIANTSSSTSSTTSTTTSTGSTLDKDAFLKLFIAQLKYQDPMNPQDSSTFMNQMAQFSTMEQLQNLNTSMGNLINMQNVTEAASLVGRTVTVNGTDGKEINGTVEKVLVSADANKIVINGESYDMSSISQVG